MIPDKLFSLLVFAWIGIAVLLFPLLLTVTAPYGRHSSKNWGPVISNRLGWIVMELPALVIVAWFIIRFETFRSFIAIAASVLWIMHYFHRAVLFPFRIHTRGKKMPLVIVLFAFVFNLVNGIFNGSWLVHLNSLTNTSVADDLRIVTGIAVFLLGFGLNQYHDRILIRLRKDRINGYQIPTGGLFRYVSCPNFLGEILEWGGYALLAWGLPPLSFFIWTIVNLVPRALNHHKWYKRNFAGYPSERKAIIPFLV